MITKNELKRFRGELTARIADLSAESETTSSSRGTVELDQQSVGRLSRMDAMQQQAMANATHQRRLAEIARAKLALQRMEEDEFGWCQECGEEIALKRLNHDPSVATCITCATGG